MSRCYRRRNQRRCRRHYRYCMSAVALTLVVEAHIAPHLHRVVDRNRLRHGYGRLDRLQWVEGH